MSAPSHRPSVLVVEDDDNIAELLAFMLRHEGFETVLLRDGRAAEEHVATREPAAAVVLDVMLPYRDGFEVAEAIRSSPRWGSVPILMLTGRALETDVERARAAGVNAYVAKPFKPQALLGWIRSAVSRVAA